MPQHSGHPPVETPTVPRRLNTSAFRSLYRGLYEPKAISRVTFRLLAAMGNHPFVRVIIRHRLRQLMRYCHIPRYRGDVGFDIVLMDEDEVLTSVAERRRDMLRDLLLHGGVLWGRPADGRPGYWAGDGKTAAMGFAQACQILLDDNMVYGGSGIRIEPGRDPRRQPVAWFRPVPGATIRMADPELYVHEYRNDQKIVEWVLLDPEGNTAWELTWQEFGYWARNPSTDPLDMGYGKSELEYAVDLLTGIHTAYRFNLGQFTENRLPPGILQIPDVIDEGVLDEFLNTLRMNIGGPAGQWHAVPIIRASSGTDKPQVQWIPLGERPSDMQWERFIVLTFAVLCELYGVNPEEVGFHAFDTRRQALQMEDPESQILHGEDTGFLPTMESLAEFWQEQVIGKFDDGAWKFQWVNLGSEHEEYTTRMSQARLSAGKSSIDEERAWSDKPLRRIPQDRALWYRVQGAVNQHFPQLYEDPDKQYELCSRLYMAKGGAWSLSTQVPIAGAALQVWQMEEMQGAGEGGEEAEDFASLLGEQSEGAGPPEEEEQEGEEEQEEQGAQSEELPAFGNPQRKGLIRRFRDGARRVIEVTLGRA